MYDDGARENRRDDDLRFDFDAFISEVPGIAPGEVARAEPLSRPLCVLKPTLSMIPCTACPSSSVARHARINSGSASGP